MKKNKQKNYYSLSISKDNQSFIIKHHQISSNIAKYRKKITEKVSLVEKRPPHTLLVPRDEEQRRVHHGGAVDHRRHQNVVSGTVHEGDVAAGEVR